MFFADRIRETTTTTGSGTVTLGGAVAQYQAFQSRVLVGDPCEYCILDANGTAWEVGQGTLQTTTTLSRDTVEESSNSDALVTLSAGTHKIFLTFGASRGNKTWVEGDSFIDYVVSGLALPTTSGNLTGTMSAGQAYVIGQRVVKGAQANTYTASKDTYVDLSNIGTLTYTAVANAAAAPALTANSIRLGFVTTNGTQITSATTTGKDSLGNWMRNTVYSPSCIVSASAGQSIAGNTVTTLTGWNTEVLDNAAMHSNSVNPSRITVAVPGKYLISGYCDWNDSGVTLNRWFFQVMKNTNVAVITSAGALSSGPNSFAVGSFAGEDIAIAGDFYEVLAYQNSGGAVSTFASGNTVPRFCCSRIG